MAGFDAHREDDIGQMDLVEADYAWITRQVMDVARVVAHLQVLAGLDGI